MHGRQNVKIAPNNENLSRINALHRAIHSVFTLKYLRFPPTQYICVLLIIITTIRPTITSISAFSQTHFSDKSMRHSLVGFLRFVLPLLSRTYTCRTSSRLIRMSALYSLEKSGTHFALRQRRFPEKRSHQPLFPYRASGD